MFHLFRKDIEKHCAYCKSGSVINEGQVICSRRPAGGGLPPPPPPPPPRAGGERGRGAARAPAISATIRSSVCRPVPPR